MDKKIDPKTPSFLNDRFILELIRSFEKDRQVYVTSFEINPGPDSNHFSSVIYKISVTYQVDDGVEINRKFILKTLLATKEEQNEYSNSVPMFISELRMYTETLPAMEKILELHNELKWWPTLVYQTEEPLTMIFEDLGQENFILPTQPLDMKEMNPVIERIAKYHALSMVIAESDQSDLVTRFANYYDATKNRPIFESVMCQGKLLGSAVKNWPGLETVGEKIGSQIETLFEKFAACYQKPSRFGWDVLNHGDLHAFNFMFKRNPQGELMDIRMLDFQIPLYQSLGFDMVYMLNSVGKHEVRMESHKVISDYQKMLAKSLQIYGFKGKVPSLLDINVEIMEMAHFDAFQKVCFVPLGDLDWSSVDMSGLFDSTPGNKMDQVLKNLFENPQFIEKMSTYLRSLNALGAFD